MLSYLPLDSWHDIRRQVLNRCPLEAGFSLASLSNTCAMKNIAHECDQFTVYLLVWYLREEARLSRAKQQAKNEARFANAKRHLARAMRRYAGYKLVDVDGVLMAQPNKRMDAAERVRLKGR